jgi:ABC-type antimicrobial peptide transport system permease subunit
MGMAVAEQVTIQKPGARGLIRLYLERNDSRIKDIQHSVRPFRKSPPAVMGLIVVTVFALLAIFAPNIAPFGAQKFDFSNPLQPPSAQHLFGTDNSDDDIFSRIVWGSRISLEIGFLVIFAAIVLGSIIGGISGYFGGWVDKIVMRISDIFLASPQLILAMVVCAALGRSIENVMLALTVVWWATYARIIRGQALSIREIKYIEAARAVGGNDLDIYRNETLGLVGKTGFGKSVTALSIIRLIQWPPGKIDEGSIIFNGQDLLKLSNKEMREIWGNKISMIFQEPMTSFNPVFTVGNQIAEVLILHQKLKKKDAWGKAIEMPTPLRGSRRRNGWHRVVPTSCREACCSVP